MINELTVQGMVIPSSSNGPRVKITIYWAWIFNYKLVRIVGYNYTSMAYSCDFETHTSSSLCQKTSNMLARKKQWEQLSHHPLIGPWGIWLQSQISTFQTHFNDKYFKYFLWNCYQVNATTPHWSLVNNGSSHYLSQCWLRLLSPYDVTRPQWVNSFI